jgi:YHS domain-containing protein
MKKMFLVLALAAASSFATADTSLVLKPDSARLAASTPVGNKKCPVSGEEIGSMGAGPVVVYQGKSVQLCCKGCLKAFGKDPAKFLAIAEGKPAASAKPAAGAQCAGHDTH